MQGSITASCGHKLADDEDTVSVWYADETCDAVDGFAPCTVYASFCPACATEWKEKGLLFADEAAADRWLDAQPCHV